MKENYLITIDNTQTDQDGPQRITLSTVGEYRYAPQKRVIRYADSSTTGFDGCETTLVVSDGCVTFTRTGKQTANLVLENGKRYTGHYGTPFGDLTLGVFTDKVEDRLDENGGSLEFSYSLDINAAFFAKNELKITVREKKRHV